MKDFVKRFDDASIVVLLGAVAIILTLAFGIATDQAQLTFAAIVAFATVYSLAESMRARDEKIQAQRRQSELDQRTVPMQESLNILATDLRGVRDESLPQLVAALDAIRAELERWTAAGGERPPGA